jgi:hypothetical protein
MQVCASVCMRMFVQAYVSVCVYTCVRKYVCASVSVSQVSITPYVGIAFIKCTVVLYLKRSRTSHRGMQTHI